MNTSVDVLEVMRKSANVASMNALDHGGKVLMNFADDCEFARAAVADLIEACEFFVNDRSGYTDLRMREAKLAKLGAALLNVKGA